MVVTFDTFFSVDWIFVGRSGSGICNITSLILCRDNMGREELIPRFRTSIHLYQWDPENPCCMAQTSWLLVNQMSIFFQSFGALTLSKKPFSKRRLSCVADMGFLKGKKTTKSSRKILPITWHPKYLLRRSILGIFWWSKDILSRCLACLDVSGIGVDLFFFLVKLPLMFILHFVQVGMRIPLCPWRCHSPARGFCSPMTGLYHHLQFYILQRTQIMIALWDSRQRS